MFSFRKSLAAMVFAGMMALGLSGAAQAQFQNPKQNITKLPQYKGNTTIPGQTFPGQPFPGQTFPNQPFPGGRCDYPEIDRLARQLERNATRLHDVVDDRSQRGNLFRQLHGEVKDLEQLADRIHDLADRRANPGFIVNEIRQAYRSSRQIDGLIGELVRTQQIDRQTALTLSRRLDDVTTTLDRMSREIRN